mgnify:CR=1 FL=1
MPSTASTTASPQQVVVYDAAALADSGLLDTLRFPLIAKLLVADGTAKSHKMLPVYHREGLAKLRPPLVLQEFVNHSGPTNGGGRKGGVAAPRADPATAVVARAASTQEHREGAVGEGEGGSRTEEVAGGAGARAGGPRPLPASSLDLGRSGRGWILRRLCWRPDFALHFASPL